MPGKLLEVSDGLADPAVVEIRGEAGEVVVVEVVEPGPQGPAGPDPWAELVVDLVASGPTEINYSAGRHVRLELVADAELAVVGWPPAGQIARLTLEIRSTGSSSIAWPTEILWSEGVPPALTPDGLDLVILSSTRGGAEILGFQAGANFLGV